MIGRAFLIASGACAIVTTGVVGGSLLAAGGVRDSAPAQTVSEGQAGASPPARSAAGGLPTGISVVANVRGAEALVYRSRGASRPWRRYANPTAQDTPLVFLVRRRVAGWLRVLLPSRPNRSEGWLLERGVSLRADRYAVLVSLQTHRLRVLREGHVLLSAPAGIGRAATPTPGGLYYITELLRQPDPHGVYGPWAFALSAFSPVLTHFGAGDGQVGLHGTNDPSGIGHTISHGCIRVRNGVIARLARLLPLGTPVRILEPADRRGTSSRKRKRGLQS